MQDTLAISENSTDYRTVSDFQMIHNLLTKHATYKIPEHLRKRVITRAGQALESDDDKLAMTAAKVLLAADKHNLDIIKVAMPKRVEHVNVSKLNDRELYEAVGNTLKLLPADIQDAITNSSEPINDR